MSDLVQTPVDIKGDGILWMVNAAVFHPRGLALSVDSEGQFRIQGDGEEVWQFQEELAQAKKDAFEEMLARHERNLR